MSTPERKFRHEPCPTCGTPQAVINHDWLRARRRDAGVSLREMARRLGFSTPYLCDVEYGRRRCSLKIRKAYEAL